jgi:hypothetical protein
MSIAIIYRQQLKFVAKFLGIKAALVWSICAAAYSKEGDQVSYLEEGKQYMYSELAKLRGSSGCGIAIHALNYWYDLSD